MKDLAKVSLRDSTMLGAIMVSISILTSLFLGQVQLSLAVFGTFVALLVVVLVAIYLQVIEIRKYVDEVRIETINRKVTKDIRIISMADFIGQESKLASGDSVLLFSSTLEYDRKHFEDVIVKNINRGVNYYYLMGGVESRRDWTIFLASLKEKGASRLPEGKFNTPDVAPLLWTTALYEFKDATRDVHAISILEHIYESEACIELSPEIARRMREHFWRFWNSLE